LTRIILACAVAAVCCAPPAGADANPETTREILALEHRAMDAWLEGNPDAVLAITPL
jgi:hypothetical protein